MKPMKLLAVILALVSPIANFNVLAQLPSALIGNPFMTKLYGSNTTFTATMLLRIRNSRGEDSTRVVASIAELEGKVRVDVNFSEYFSKAWPTNALDSLKQMHMDRVACIVLPDKNMMYMIYPNLKSYVTMPLQKDQAHIDWREWEIEKKLVKSELFDGHPCEVNDVTFRSKTGRQERLTVWNATDLKGFPIKFEFPPDRGDSSIVENKMVRFEKPDTNQFDPPAGFAAYDNMQKLILVESQRFAKEEAERASHTTPAK